MPRDIGALSPGDWIEEKHPPRRRLQVMAIHSRVGHPTPNVELAVDGNPVDRLSLSLYAVNDQARFRKMPS
ncbi:hypothetical protein [Oleisolibacter albus]|uniref:hypothetical protein n=1 Tax=Oleisolibacter albus TaxID=2171757 RepID=UPI000DF1B289|nr:hypothetical protein [Oleisolibacter albus]